jgi:hypothetical protein
MTAYIIRRLARHTLLNLICIFLTPFRKIDAYVFGIHHIIYSFNQISKQKSLGIVGSYLNSCYHSKSRQMKGKFMEPADFAVQIEEIMAEVTSEYECVILDENDIGMLWTFVIETA